MYAAFRIRVSQNRDREYALLAFRLANSLQSEKPAALTNLVRSAFDASPGPDDALDAPLFHLFHSTSLVSAAA